MLNNWYKKEKPIQGMIGMGGGATGYISSGGGSGLGSSSDNPANNAYDIIQAGDSVGDGLYWINVNGTPKQVWCDMTAGSHSTGSNPGGWMMVYKCDANGNNSCGNGVWDFNSTYNYGAADPPTSPYGSITNGQGQGLSTSNRNSFWNNSTSVVHQRTMLWSGRSTAVDVKVELTAGYDTGNSWYNFVAGTNGTTGYSNANIGNNSGICRYTSGHQTGLSVGTAYQVYQLGHWACNCCESMHYNGAYNSTSSDTSMLFGDGNYQGGNHRDFEWCCFFVR